MALPVGYRRNQPAVWYSGDLAKSNQFCPYCHVFVGAGSAVPSDREHLIARNFVPAGSLNGTAFNFIFRACVSCNNEKSDAERHVSSVSMFNSPAREHDPHLNDIATRKGVRDYHPTTRAPVEDSHLSENVRYDMGALKASFNLVAPPQTDLDAVMLLAARHVQGFFALISTEDPRDPDKTRLLPARNVLVLDDYPFHDWGNPQLVEVNNRTRSWPQIFALVTAKGYFKAVIRKAPTTDGGYFWALEWNKSIRVVGAVADPEAHPEWITTLPPLRYWRVPSFTGTGTARMRHQVPLDPLTDTLFAFDTATEDSPRTI